MTASIFLSPFSDEMGKLGVENIFPIQVDQVAGNY